MRGALYKTVTLELDESGANVLAKMLRQISRNAYKNLGMSDEEIKFLECLWESLDKDNESA